MRSTIDQEEVLQLLSALEDRSAVPDVDDVYRTRSRRNTRRRAAGATAGLVLLAGGIGLIADRINTPVEVVVAASNEPDLNEQASSTTDDPKTPPTTERIQEDALVTSEENRIYLALSIEDAGSLAEANGLEWRTVNIDGAGQEVLPDIRERRLNFWVVDQVVVTAVTDIELFPGAGEESPPVLESETRSNFISLTAEEAGKLADESEYPWRIVVVDGVSQRISHELNRDRLNFVVAEGVVLKVLTDWEISER